MKKLKTGKYLSQESYSNPFRDNGLEVISMPQDSFNEAMEIIKKHFSSKEVNAILAIPHMARIVSVENGDKYAVLSTLLEEKKTFLIVNINKGEKNNE